MKKTLVILSSLSSTIINAQDLHFSQFYENGLLRNPALIGIFSKDYKVGVGYRNQWSSVTTPYRTYLAAAETRIGISDEANDCLSLGLTITNDVAGTVDFNSVQAAAAINYNKALGENNHSFLSLGFSAGFIQRALNTSKMTFSTQYFGGTYNPGVPTGENLMNTKLTYLDIGTGLSFNSSAGQNNRFNYYVGVGAFHVNRPKAAFGSGESFVRMDMKWTGNFGFMYQISDELGVTSHFNYFLQGQYQEIIGGGLLSWRKINADKQTSYIFSTGLFYRLNDAIIPTIKLDYQKYTFIVSYDINTSTLKTVSNSQGGIEISVISQGNINHKPWKQDKTKCPKFEQMIMPNYEQ